MIPALLLVLEGVILFTFSADLSTGGLLLATPFRVVLFLCAALGLAGTFWPASLRRTSFRAPTLALGAGCLLLGSLGIAEGRALRLTREGWDATAAGRLESRARAIEEDFRGFLAELSRPIAVASERLEERSLAFAALARARAASHLPADRLGFTIYRSDGAPMGWDGNSSDAPRALLAMPCPGPGYSVGGSETSRRLYAAVCSSDGLRWVAEFVLEPPGEGEAREAALARLAFLPHWQEAGPATVRFRDDTTVDQDDLARLLQSQGDRHWRRLGGEGVLTLVFPLRSPNGEQLAMVTLLDQRASQEIGERRRAFRLHGGLVTALALLLAWSLTLRSGTVRPALLRLAMGTAAIWSIRWSLLAMADAASLPRVPIYDILIYSSATLFGLLRSPFDLLLTAAACCIQAWIIDIALRTVDAGPDARTSRSLRTLGIVAALVVIVAGLLGLHLFLDRMVLDLRLDISRVESGPLLSPRFALQASLFLLVLSAGLLLRAFLDLALRHAPRVGRWALLHRIRGADSEGIPFALRTAGWMLLLTLSYATILNHSYDRIRKAFFDDELRPLVLEQKSMRRQAARESLTLACDPDFAAVAALAAEGSASAAYRLWRKTPVADRGLASSLRIFDARGALLGRFAFDFAPMLEVPFDEARMAADEDFLVVPPRPDMTVRKPVLVGSRWVGGPRLPLLVVLTVSDDYDNLPILGGGTVGAGLFRSMVPVQSNPELLKSEPLVAVFSPGLSRLYESGGEIPPPSPATLAAIEKDGHAWTADNLRGGDAYVLYFRGAREIFALAHLHSSRTATLAGYLRLFLLNGLLAILVVAFARAVFWIAHPQLPRLTLGATFSRRLVTVFLLAGLLPLLTLAYLVTRSTTREIDRDVTTTGLASLQVARRVAEDYLTVSGPEVADALDDDVVYWLSRVVRQDVHIYRDADLVATSARELYASGLLNTRLNGASYRAIYLDRDSFWLNEERTGSLDFLVMTAPIRIDRQGTTGAISMPLVEHRRAATHREEEIEDAVLIVTCLTVLLLAIVGNLVAHGVSRPVALLAVAARRVAGGDLAVRVDTTASDETAILVDAFNRMADSLQRQRDDLRHRTDYIEKILRSATTGVVSIDGSSTIITINPAAQGLLTGSRGTPEVGQDLQVHLAGDPALAPLLTPLRRRLAGQTEREMEIEIARPRGSPVSGLEATVPQRVRAVFIPFAPEEARAPGLIVLLEDVTEIVRSGRLAAWAEMARRVAHEIKNPLTPIQLSIEHVRRVFKAKDPRFERVLTECLDNVQKQVEVLREIAYEFSAYARLPQLRPETVAVQSLLDEALKPYVTAAPPGVRIVRQNSSELPSIHVDRAVLVRALVNLIENALHAMHGGGTLSVGGALAQDSAGNRRVVITVRDTGEGIPEDVLPRLFEPYFSTKSGGTGLGLGLARRAVEEHGGRIEIRSRRGEGTVVTLTLPVAAESAGGDRVTNG